MATSKTLFDAVEAEMHNARTAINNTGAYMDLLKKAVDSMAKASGIEAPLSVSSSESGTDVIVKTESGEYGIPLVIETEDETKIYGFNVGSVNKESEERRKLKHESDYVAFGFEQKEQNGEL